MTNEQIFLREGASYFGNRLIYKNKDVGVTAPGAALVLTAEGEEIMEKLRDITDVEVKPTRSKKAKADDAVVEVPTGPAIDDILG